ncbi:MAG TPA: hypothetical protein VFT62_00795 [Mycobacteriales bacterium]|nr:hypothetical protein [Mycobacteriales bacterium]
MHAPIALGVLYAVNDGAAAAGINNGNTFSLSKVMHAFVDSYNASGGIGGRHIQPVYAELHSYNSNYEAQIAAACAAFTQDHHVAAVLSNTQYFSEQLLACLAKAGVPLISGDFAGPDRQDAQRYPLFITPTTLVGEDREAAVVGHLAGSGWLQPRNRIGVVVENCPVDQRIYRSGLLPALRRAHLTLASTFSTQCFQSIQDFGTQTSQMSSAVLQFRQARVDRVMFVSQGAEANLVLAFSEVANQQQWHPGYALSSLAVPEALALNAPAAQLANARGLGWLPALDTQDLRQAPATSTGRACLARLQRQGIRPTSGTDLATVSQSCDAFALFDAILHSTGGDAAGSAVLRAVARIGDRFVAATTVGGHERLWGGHLGPASGRLFAWVANKGFRYTSRTFPL